MNNNHSAVEQIRLSNLNTSDEDFWSTAGSDVRINRIGSDNYASEGVKMVEGPVQTVVETSESDDVAVAS